ncbi:hypothetical protein BDZ94DRAFT_1171952 [Collybia nuda]|uniref:Uncharacterized protein n=1 Tax=Collybia nuda TaxID=64659 RepID=A0A9P5Y128_9AGAR|nr:hypothetical protein BDZ94DRAFT_1171952 [Collybia nuda]
MLLPLSATSSSDALFHDDNNKFPGTQIFLRQQHTVQIIQLVECDPPPPRRITSVIGEGQASSSSSYASSSEYSESSTSDEGDDDDDNNNNNNNNNEGGEDEEAACSSYCSSDVPPQPLPSPSPQFYDMSNSPPRPDPYADTHLIRMKRILAWRENFSTHLTDTLSEPSLSSSLKRKMDLEDNDDMMSHTSKRSRSQASQADASVRVLGVHACPACDAFFSTRQSLLQHGRDAKANEACSVAVEYAFE